MNNPSLIPQSPLFATRKTLAVALASTLLLSAASEASSITYTSQYTGNAVPALSGGTIADPSWAQIVSPDSVAEASGGVLSGSTMNSTEANQQFWLLGQHDDESTYGTYQAWSINPSVGFTVDFRIQIISEIGSEQDRAGGFMIQVADGVRVGSFYFGTDTIYYSGASTSQIPMPLNLTTGFTTFRITGKDSSYSLYMEGMDTPLFDNLLGGSLPGYNRVVWGDFNQSVSGAYNLDSLNWNNQLAEFSAPVPEPSTALLLMGGLTAGLVVFYRNR